MADEDTDYEMEYEALQARLLPFADHMLAQLEDARMLANHQRADRDIDEWLDDPTQHPEIMPLVPLAERLIEPVEQRLLRPWISLAVFGVVTFALGFAVRCLLSKLDSALWDPTLYAIH